MVVIHRKVIHVITRLDYGGSAQNTMLTVLGHDRTLYEPVVVAGAPGRWDAQGGQPATDANGRCLEKEGIRCVMLPTLVREIHVRNDIRALWELVKLFRREQPHLVHTHTSKAGVLGRLAAWLARVPVMIHTPHGHVFYGHFGRVRSWIFMQVERLLTSLTTRMIALTESERDEHLQRKIGRADHFVVVPSGIDLDKFRRARSRESQPVHGFSLPLGGVVVGSVGWLTPVKGHRYLIEAVTKLLPGFPYLHVMLVGSGDLRDELAAMGQRLGLGDRLHLLGHRDDVEACLAAMDLFVLPSLNEGMGRALVEAMAAGLPIVATRVGGVPAIVQDQVNGLLVPPGDADALAEALRSLLSRPERMKQLGEAASRSIGQRYGTDAMVRSIEALYQESFHEVNV